MRFRKENKAIMAKKYSNQETIDVLNKEIAKGISRLYSSECVNWIGRTRDEIYYSEIIAKELLNSLKEFDRIPRITRNSSYKIHNHSQIVIDLSKSNRLEDIFAKRLFGLEFKELGKILDYQIPIRDTNKDEGLKAFDLLSFNKADSSFYLIELKYLGNRETLLRATLECYTYFKLIDHDKLISDYRDDVSVNDSIKIKPVVLLVGSDENPCNSYKEFCDLNSKDRPNLKAFSLALGIKFVTCDLPLTFKS